MIYVKLPQHLVDEHWKWFKKILDDKEDWTRPKKEQPSIPSNQKQTRRDFINRQFNFSSDTQIEELICADYKAMQNIIQQPFYVSKTFYNHNDKRGLSGNRISEGDRNALIRAFGYEEFTDLDEPHKWGAYTFCHKLSVNVCPYCNREYVFTVVKDKKRQPVGSKRSPQKRLIRPQIEHFFPKSIYPFFSCSIYNMIPGCSICNSKKSSVDTYLHPMIYPYKEEFGKKGHFLVDFDIDKIKGSDDSVFDKELEDDISVKIRSYDGKKIDKKIRQSVKKLILEELYSCHQIEIKNILKRFRLTTLTNVQRYDRMMLNTSFAEDIILGRPLCKKSEYPLRKFSEDIIEQLKDGKKI